MRAPIDPAPTKFGTFNVLDGEMVAVDGRFFHRKISHRDSFVPVRAVADSAANSPALVMRLRMPPSAARVTNTDRRIASPSLVLLESSTPR